MKFIDPLRKLYDYHAENKRKPLVMKVLTTLSLISAFFLYLSDNILWLANMGIIKKMFFQKVKWKRFKDFFALWKNIIEIIKYLLDQMRTYKKKYDILNKMNEF